MATITNEMTSFGAAPVMDAETYEPATAPRVVTLTQPMSPAAEQYRVLRYRLECLAKSGLVPDAPLTVEELIIKAHFAPSGVLVRKDCFARAGFFDTSLRNAEDYDMWIRIAASFPVVKLEAPLWWYRVHGANKSHVPARQEAAGLRVLGKTFAPTSPLSKRYLLKRKAYSYAAYAAAQNFSSVGRELPALTRMLRSLLFWPFPYQRHEVTTALARPKKLIITLLRLLRVLPRNAPRISAHVPSAPPTLPHQKDARQRDQ